MQAVENWVIALIDQGNSTIAKDLGDKQSPEVNATVTLVDLRSITPSKHAESFVNGQMNFAIESHPKIKRAEFIILDRKIKSKTYIEQ